MWGVCGPPSPSLSNRLWAVDNGVLFIWAPMSYAKEGYWFVHSLAEIFWKAQKYSLLEGCATLHSVVHLVRAECQKFEGCEPSILDVKAFFFHTLLDWNVAFYPSLCFSLLDLVEHCTLRAVWNSPRVHPPVYLVLFLLIKFLLLNQKQKTICTLQCLSHLDITNWGIYGEKNG